VKLPHKTNSPNIILIDLLNHQQHPELGSQQFLSSFEGLSA